MVTKTQNQDIIYTNHKEVSCDGGILGHPKIYLNMETSHEIICPYCSRKFVLKNIRTIIPENRGS